MGAGELARFLMLATVGSLLTGCGGSGSAPAVPHEVASACGHPNATVRIHHLPMTIQHRNCDLTGVRIQYLTDTIRVPASGSEGDSFGLVVSVGHNGDVTIKASGPVGGNQ